MPGVIAFIPEKPKLVIGSVLAVVGLVLLILALAGTGGTALIIVGIGLLVIGAGLALDAYGTMRTTRGQAT